MDEYLQIYDSPKHGRTFLVRLGLKTTFFLVWFSALFFTENTLVLWAIGLLAGVVGYHGFFGSYDCPQCRREMKMKYDDRKSWGTACYLVCDHCKCYIDTGVSSD